MNPQMLVMAVALVAVLAVVALFGGVSWRELRTPPRETRREVER